MRVKLIKLNAVLFLAIIGQTLFAQSKNPFDAGSAVENASELKPGENIDEKIKNNFFLKAEVTKKDCYVGEAVMATFKAYSRLDANSQVVKRPSLSGFSVMEMVDVYNSQPDVEKYNGKYYYVHLIRKVQLFPLQPGNFTLETAEIESVIHFRNKDPHKGVIKNIRDLFSKDHGYDASLDRQINLETPPVTINVKQLPEAGQPEDFSGAVGNFSVKMLVKDTRLKQHEIMVARLMIKGQGNFPLITDPEIKWPEGLEVSDPQVEENVDPHQYPLPGAKIFQYSIQTRDTGSFLIPPVRFSYFDASARKYITVRTDSVRYTVSPAEKNTRKDQQIVIVPKDLPLHYYYFGVIAAAIAGWIIFQLLRGRKKKTS